LVFFICSNYKKKTSVVLGKIIFKSLDRPIQHVRTVVIIDVQFVTFSNMCFHLYEQGLITNKTSEKDK